MGAGGGGWVHCRKGKTTLLKHIANRALSIPPNIDVLLCEQGETPPKSTRPPRTPPTL